MQYQKQRNPPAEKKIKSKNYNNTKKPTKILSWTPNRSSTSEN